jgi:signal transduction histidine kinase
VLAVNRALDRLQQAMRTLESFTADAAHEMRTPLAILKLRIDALGPSPEKNLLREDVAAMTRLVNQMLDLAQADTLDAQMNQTVDLAALARDVVSRMLPVAFTRGCDIELIDEGGGVVAGHAEALARVLANIIDNAIAHSPPGRSIDVKVGPGCRLVVRDRGPGFSTETAELLFRRFWRGPVPGRAGAGLGLAIAQSILSRHGATITAANAVDGGAVFTIQWSNENVT